MKPRQLLGRVRLQLRGNKNVVGWEMTPAEAQAFFRGVGKTVLTFFGYSAGYEDDKAVLDIIQRVLSEHSPASTLINYGATRYGLGLVYPLARKMGFVTAGIVSTQALRHPESISGDVDHICFIADEQWGGKLPGSDELSPTSRAMVACSDILVGIGGGEISRDEMAAGRDLGKPVHFYPAEVNHAWLIERARRQGLPPPESFWGAAHEVFADRPPGE